MEDQERPQNHQRVPNAEHVRPRPAGGDGEDVAEKSDVSVLDQIRIGELSRRRIEAGRGQRAARRRHHAAVRRYRDEVEQPTHRHDPHEAQVEVPQDACRREAVGPDVRRAVQALAPVRRNRDEQHLDSERQRCQPQPADPHLLEPAQPSSRHWDRDEQQEEGEQEGHLWGPGRVNSNVRNGRHDPCRRERRVDACP